MTEREPSRSQDIPESIQYNIVGISYGFNKSEGWVKVGNEIFRLTNLEFEILHCLRDSLIANVQNQSPIMKSKRLSWQEISDETGYSLNSFSYSIASLSHKLEKDLKNGKKRMWQCREENSQSSVLLTEPAISTELIREETVRQCAGLTFGVLEEGKSGFLLSEVPTQENGKKTEISLPLKLHYYTILSALSERYDILSGFSNPPLTTEEICTMLSIKPKTARTYAYGLKSILSLGFPDSYSRLSIREEGLILSSDPHMSE